MLEILSRLNSELGKTVLMVTHDPLAASKAQRLLELDKGVLIEDRQIEDQQREGA